MEANDLLLERVVRSGGMDVWSVGSGCVRDGCVRSGGWMCEEWRDGCWDNYVMNV